MKLQFPWNFQLPRPADWRSIKWTCWRWELETSEGIEAANSNACYQGTAGPSVRPFRSFCESTSWLILTFSANAVCIVYRMHSLSSVTHWGLFSAQWLEWQFSIFTDGIKFPAQAETLFWCQVEGIFFLVQWKSACQLFSNPLEPRWWRINL